MDKNLDPNHVTPPETDGFVESEDADIPSAPVWIPAEDYRRRPLFNDTDAVKLDPTPLEPKKGITLSAVILAGAALYFLFSLSVTIVNGGKPLTLLLTIFSVPLLFLGIISLIQDIHRARNPKLQPRTLFRKRILVVALVAMIGIPVAAVGVVLLFLYSISASGI